MLTKTEKEQLRKMLEEMLCADSATVKQISSSVLTEVKNILVDYREEYLKMDSDTYNQRADALEMKMRDILSQALESFNLNITKLHTTMNKIAADQVHSIVNSSLLKIDNKLSELKTTILSNEERRKDSIKDVSSLINVVNEKVEKVKKKTIYFALANAMDENPIRTIGVLSFIFMLFLATLLQIWHIPIHIDKILHPLLKLFTVLL